MVLYNGGGPNRFGPHILMCLYGQLMGSGTTMRSGLVGENMPPWRQGFEVTSAQAIPRI